MERTELKAVRRINAMMPRLAFWHLVVLLVVLALAGSAALSPGELDPSAFAPAPPSVSARPVVVPRPPPTPKVIDVRPTGDDIATTKPIIVIFDRPLGPETLVPVALEPPLPLERSWYSERVLVLRHPPFERATSYQVSVRLHQTAHSSTFRTAEPATVVAYGPQGNRVVPSGSVRVTFSEAPNRIAAERAFRVEPPTKGRFEWADKRTLVWHPQSLRPAQTYDVHVGGATADGDAVAPASWRFGTVARPPAVLPAPNGRLVLTFDDDPPAPAIGFALLDLLARYQVRAILFPTGAWAKQNPSFVQRARADGQLVCNHTYAHADLTALGNKDMRFQILHGAGAGHCDLLRAPYGRLNKHVEALANALGFRMYEWNIDSEDWKGKSAAAITSGILNDARPGGVALFHMHGRHTLEALPAIVWGLRVAGYELSY